MSEQKDVVIEEIKQFVRDVNRPVWDWQKPQQDEDAPAEDGLDKNNRRIGFIVNEEET